MDKHNEEYEEINFDNKDDIHISNDDMDEEEDPNEPEVNGSEDVNELESMALQLSRDYSNYFKFDINSEKKETEDAIEDLLTHLEEFCGLIEMIRNDNNICLEEVLKKITNKSKLMDEMYTKVDQLEQFVRIVRQCVDDMEKELTKAEQLFGDSNNNRVKKFFTSFMSNTSKQNTSQRIDAKYEPKDIFKTSHFIKTCDLGLVSGQTDDCPKSDQSSQQTDCSND